MALSEIFFLAIVLYLLYRFVFNFLVPVLRTTRQVRQQFRNMQDAMRNQAGGQSNNPNGENQQYYQQQQRAYQQQAFSRQQQQNARPQTPPPPGGKTSSGGSGANNTMGEYIDFEEIK